MRGREASPERSGEAWALRTLRTQAHASHGAGALVPADNAADGFDQLFSIVTDATFENEFYVPKIRYPRGGISLDN